MGGAWNCWLPSDVGGASCEVGEPMVCEDDSRPAAGRDDLAYSSPDQGSAASRSSGEQGLSNLARVLDRTEDGITILDGQRRYVYANRAACRILGRSLEDLQGQPFLDSFATGEHVKILSHISESFDGSSHDAATSGGTAGPSSTRGLKPSRFFTLLADADRADRDVACALLPLDMPGDPHCMVILRELAGPGIAARTALGLVEAAHVLGSGTPDETLVAIARMAAEETRASACAITVVGEDGQLFVAGAYGLPLLSRGRPTWRANPMTLQDVPGADVLAANKPVVRPFARCEYEASPVLAASVAALKGVDWQAAAAVPLTWEDELLGWLWLPLPSAVAAPSTAEFALFTALADQAALVVKNSREAAAAERARLAHELHDSVSQALFSMTMHARAAQLSMAKAGLDADAPLAGSITQLVELTRGALAEMRALIFEFRPGALAEEGLVPALRKQAAALSARERLAIGVQGPDERLELASWVEEHLYRIVSEALHNVVKHAKAREAVVDITVEAATVRVSVVDDGTGFEQMASRPGHLGLSTMAQRAAAIGADLAITSTPGIGTAVTVSLTHNRRVRRMAS